MEETKGKLCKREMTEGKKEGETQRRERKRDGEKCIERGGR